MTKLIKLTALLLPLVIWMSACDEGDDPPQTAPTGLEIQEAPETMLANIDSIYTIRCRVADEGVNPEYILCEVAPPGDGTVESFRLYDDGGTTVLPAHPYAGETSGDIVPNNDSYTRTVNGRLLAAETGGNYLFSFSVPGQTSSIYSKQVTVLAANIEDCLISSGTPLGILSACFEPLALEVHVDRSDFDEVDSVWLAEINPEPTYRLNLPRFERAGSDTTWQALLSPSFARCLPTGGPYELEYRARTRFGMECSQVVTIENFVNSLPVLSTSTLPDTAYRPPADSTLISFTVQLQDCELQGEQNYYGLEFETRRDWQNWGRSTAFFLRDDGTAPDAIPGDSTYSSWLVISHSDSLFNNLYYFRFYAVDCAAPYDTSEFLLDSLRIIQPEASIMTGLLPDKSDVGFGILNTSNKGDQR